jgi:hypothetical protein
VANLPAPAAPPQAAGEPQPTRIESLAYDKAADDGNVTGAPRFHAHVAVVMLVPIALATLLAMAPREGGVLGQTRLSAVAQALRKKVGLASG